MFRASVTMNMSQRISRRLVHLPAPVTFNVSQLAIWKQIATAFAGFSSKLMFECFNEPGGGGTALNSYVEACVNAVRGTGGANATRVVMIQGQGASPSSTGISTMLKISVINDPNLNCKKTNPLKRKNPFCFLQNGLLKNYREDPE